MAGGMFGNASCSNAAIFSPSSFFILSLGTDMCPPPEKDIRRRHVIEVVMTRTPLDGCSLGIFLSSGLLFSVEEGLVYGTYVMRSA